MLPADVHLWQADGCNLGALVILRGMVFNRVCSRRPYAGTWTIIKQRVPMLDGAAGEHIYRSQKKHLVQCRLAGMCADDVRGSRRYKNLQMLASHLKTRDQVGASTLMSAKPVCLLCSILWID